MGNTFCPVEDIAKLSTIARDICPYPNYNPSPHFVNMLSPDSSLHLRNHYRAVQSSLSPQQLDDFTRNLKTTFGREGKVTLGGVGVVALSLAVLFDTLAKKAKGEWVSESEPIPGLFVKDLRGYYPPHVYTISKYLRLVPHIANNPTRMREETERCMKQIILDDKFLKTLDENHMLPINEDITQINGVLGFTFFHSLNFHFKRINITAEYTFASSEGKQPDTQIYNLNCNPQTADREFLAAVQRSDSSTQEAFQRCSPSGNVGGTWLEHLAKIESGAVMSVTLFGVISHHEALIAQRGDFDLKTNALKWTE